MKKATLHTLLALAFIGISANANAQTSYRGANNRECAIEYHETNKQISKVLAEIIGSPKYEYSFQDYVKRQRFYRIKPPMDIMHHEAYNPSGLKECLKYRDIALREARQIVDEAKDLSASGKDPYEAGDRKARQ